MEEDIDAEMEPQARVIVTGTANDEVAEWFFGGFNRFFSPRETSEKRGSLRNGFSFVRESYDSIFVCGKKVPMDFRLWKMNFRL